jgi:hypothetical protein
LTPEERRLRVRLRAARRGRAITNEAAADSLDGGAKLLLRAYHFLESEEFAHLPLSDQEEFKDDLCELEELHKSLGPDNETLNAKYRILRAVVVNATAKHPDLQRLFLAVLDDD